MLIVSICLRPGKTAASICASRLKAGSADCSFRFRVGGCLLAAHISFCTQGLAWRESAGGGGERRAGAGDGAGHRRPPEWAANLVKWEPRRSAGAPPNSGKDIDLKGHIVKNGLVVSIS
jgi:hypothetical protein